jgi:hypothetical protein
VVLVVLVVLVGFLAKRVATRWLSQPMLRGGASSRLARGVIGLCWLNPERPAKAPAAATHEVAAARSPA